MQDIVTLKKKRRSSKRGRKVKNSTYGVTFFIKPVNLPQQNMSPQPHAPIMAEQ